MRAGNKDYKEAEMKLCSIDGCGREHDARGWCQMHYKRWKRHGGPQKMSLSRRPVTWEYLLSCSVVNEATGCIVWQKCLNGGYGWLRRNGEEIRTHRLSYKLNVGPIPQGLHVLHHCDNPPCINPDHLFLGTHADNMKDARNKGRMP